MVIPLNPLTTLLALLTLGIDIGLFFLLVRLLWLWRPVKGLAGLNQAGEILVNQIVKVIEILTRKFTACELSEKGKLAIGITFLTLVNLLLKALLHGVN